MQGRHVDIDGARLETEQTVGGHRDCAAHWCCLGAPDGAFLRKGALASHGGLALVVCSNVRHAQN